MYVLRIFKCFVHDLLSHLYNLIYIIIYVCDIERVSLFVKSCHFGMAISIQQAAAVAPSWAMRKPSLPTAERWSMTTTLPTPFGAWDGTEMNGGSALERVVSIYSRNWEEFPNHSFFRGIHRISGKKKDSSSNNQQLSIELGFDQKTKELTTNRYGQNMAKLLFMWHKNQELPAN